MRKLAVIVRPILTEKTYFESNNESKYTFEVLKDANKSEIALAFKEIFNIKPVKVNIINVKPQNTRTGSRSPVKTAFIKKAIITLPKGTKLNLMGEENNETNPNSDQNASKEEVK